MKQHSSRRMDVALRIVTLLGERVQARKSRDFDLADNIRDDLRNDYMAEVDDWSKDWVVLASEGGSWVDDDDDGLNVVSKQECDTDVDEEEDEVDADDEDFDDEEEEEEEVIEMVDKIEPEDEDDES
ncbi:hypothetical protein ACHAXR_010475 [Thalassiosira sp. AJA248-18]